MNDADAEMMWRQADEQRKLTRLEQKIGQARNDLAMLRRDLRAAQELEWPPSEMTLLREANALLTQCALMAQADAQAARQALLHATHSLGFDPLTELPNRTLLHNRFMQASANAQRHGARMAILFLDLNGFKRINDSTGHAGGDEVLKLAARRLAESVREGDTVSRYGGDEFVILLAEVSQEADVLSIAGKALDALREPARIGDRELRLTAAVGIAVYPDDGTDIGTLIRLADTAMYRAKQAGDAGGAMRYSELPASSDSPMQSALLPTSSPRTELAASGVGAASHRQPPKL